MPSETDVLNMALGKIGQSSISGIDDPSKSGHWCKIYYPQRRRALLRAHFWNFAETRINLNQDFIPPGSEFAYAYTTPPDMLRIKTFNGILLNASLVAIDPAYWTHYAGLYKIEGKKLLTNDTSVNIVYVADVENPDVWDSLFLDVVVTWLASELALAIAHDVNKANSLLTQAVNLLLPLAAAVDGQEGSVQRTIVNDLLWGR